eukprot:13347-Heterococcus_DN1.PRE.2
MRLVEVQEELTNERAAFSAVLAKKQQQQHHKHSKHSYHKHKRSSHHTHGSTHDRNKRKNNSTTHSNSNDCDSDSSSSDDQHEHDNELFVLGDATDDTNTSKVRDSNAYDCSRSSSSSMISLQGNKAQRLHAYLSAKAKHVSQLRRESQEWQKRCITACSKWSQLTEHNAELQVKIQHQSVALSLRDETIATLQTLLHSKDAQLTTLHSTVAELATATAVSSSDGSSGTNNSAATTASVKRKQVSCQPNLHALTHALVYIVLASIRSTSDFGVNRVTLISALMAHVRMTTTLCDILQAATLLVSEIERTRNETHTVIADLVQAMSKYQQQQQQQQQQQHVSTTEAAAAINNTAHANSSSSSGYIQLQQKCDALQQKLDVSDRLGGVHAVVTAHELIGGWYHLTVNLIVCNSECTAHHCVNIACCCSPTRHCC